MMISDLANELCEYIVKSGDDAYMMTSGRAIVFTKNKIKYKFTIRLIKDMFIMYYAGKYGDSVRKSRIDTRSESIITSDWIDGAYQYLCNTIESYKNVY